MAGLLFGILGPLRVERQKGELRVGGARRRGVLLRLLASANEAVPVDLLAEDVWDGNPPSAVVSTLQSHVSDLRQLLGPDRLVFARGAYLVRAGPDELDVTLFEGDLAEGRVAIGEGRMRDGVELLEQGLGRWRGFPFADVAGAAWALAPSARLEEERNIAVEEALEARLGLGWHDEVCLMGEDAVATEPFRERRWGILMLALYRAERQADALRVFQRARHTLADELGIDPSPQLVRLENDILQHDPRLDWSGPATPRASTAGVLRSERERSSLPIPVSGFVGRRWELAELQRLIGAYRLVSLVGTGGIGKTRLAIEAAARCIDQFDDGVWFVDLAAVSVPGGVASAVATAVGLFSNSDESVESVLVDRIRGMASLLVFDNCEHLIEETAATVEALLEAGPGLRVLATSRSALRLPGERVWLAPPIDTPSQFDDFDPSDILEFDAVRLFLERAAEASALEDPSAEDLRLIGRLTSALDGLPLAIELAAARVGTLGLEQVSSLDDRLGLIGEGSRTARSRHKTMAATIDWSYQLSSPDLQAAFRRLSVFVGGFGLEAATDVISETDVAANVAAALSGLVELSLVSYERPDTGGLASHDRGRYAMLETIRQFAVSRLEVEDGADGALAAREAHSKYFSGLAARASGALVGWQQGQWLAALETEHANLAATLAYLLGQSHRAQDALRMIVQLDRFWHNRGHLAECMSLVNQAAELIAIETDAELRCAALKLGGQAMVRRDPIAAQARFAACMEIARDSGDDHHGALALAGMAIAYHYLGDRAACRINGHEAVEVARGIGDPVLLGECLIAYGLSLTEDLDLCTSVHDEAISVTRASGDRVNLGYALNNLGNCLLAHGQVSAAGDLFRQTRSIFEEIGALDSTPLINSGWVSLRQGDIRGARDVFGESVRLARRLHSPGDQAYGLLGLACAAATDGDDDERAAALFGFADVELERCGEQSWMEPECSFRQDALDLVRTRLGSRAGAAYDLGRFGDRQEMLRVALG
jgi:predicted ATPase/DNA-binding SARP family transcriptional activator/Tfp pilus assembly protein PilF